MSHVRYDESWEWEYRLCRNDGFGGKIFGYEEALKERASQPKAMEMPMKHEKKH